jgi:hypothetical protein
MLTIQLQAFDCACTNASIPQAAAWRATWKLDDELRTAVEAALRPILKDRLAAAWTAS